MKSEFATADPEQACALFAEAYGESRLKISGSTENFRLAQSRYDLGQLRLDAFHNTLTTAYEAAPFGCVQIVRVLDTTVGYELGDSAQRFGPGDVFLFAQPDRPESIRTGHARLQVVGLDLPLLAEVTGEPPLEAVRRFRTGALPPTQARLFEHALTIATAMVTRPEAQAPLMLDAVRRLVTGAALTAFDPESLVEGPRDRTDAHPVAVRRAVAHIESHPDVELAVADIARAANVSIRALQVAFRRHLDATPMAYLRRVRMDRIHAELAAGDPDSTTVTAVAARWGFHTAGRFSADYRSLYGELPRETLRRR